MSDPTEITMRQYDDGRLMVVARGKVFGPPIYQVFGHQNKRNGVAHENFGFYRNVGVTVTDVKSGELVLSFQSRIPVELIEA